MIWLLLICMFLILFVIPLKSMSKEMVFSHGLAPFPSDLVCNVESERSSWQSQQVLFIADSSIGSELWLLFILPLGSCWWQRTTEAWGRAFLFLALISRNCLWINANQASKRSSSIRRVTLGRIETSSSPPRRSIRTSRWRLASMMIQRWNELLPRRKKRRRKKWSASWLLNSKYLLRVNMIF